MDINDFCLAERENNRKRRHIVINKIQGKHFPCSPTVTDMEFCRHAENVGRFIAENGISAENTVVIGFAETAVAIGAYIARELGAFYIATTREKLPDCFEGISFEESHSHAAEHSLCIRDKRVFQNADCVIIADDEFTTGKTAVKLVKALESYIPIGCRIIAAAFIASDESRERFAANGILCFAEQELDGLGYEQNGERVPDTVIEPRKPTWEIKLNSVLDFRLGVDAQDYFAECEKICKALCVKLDDVRGEDTEVSVIGTEELCVPQIILGKMLEERGCLVSVQGVTRSPMIPLNNKAYPINNRAKLKSLYDSERDVFLYNKFRGCNTTIIITDADDSDSDAVNALCGAVDGCAILVYWRGKKMRTSLKSEEDCTLLLKDITGLIEPMTAKEREPLIQSGIHYSELLPAEYQLSAEYIKQFERGLSVWSTMTAEAVRVVAERIYAKGRNVIVSLARAGTPVGALIVRYLRRKYGEGFVHYSISIIRGKGIDKNALRYILARHYPDKIQFVDGWTGKGAITRQLAEALADYPEIDPLPAVIADPAGVCEICGTREDIFIPCACLNAVVSGLFSRTVLRDDIIAPDDFHGAVYFHELEEKDRTYEFIRAIEEKMNYGDVSVSEEPFERGCGLRETEEIAKAFGVGDINLVKPGIGETTRVLLRRIPRLILVDRPGSPLTAHIEELAAEKGVEVRDYPLKCYHACGIIQMLGDV